MNKTKVLELYKVLGATEEKAEKKAYNWWESLTGVGRSFVVARLAWARLSVGEQLVEELKKLQDRQDEYMERLEKLNRAQVRLLRDLLDAVAPEEPEDSEPVDEPERQLPARRPRPAEPVHELVPRRREEEEDTAEVPSAAGSAQ